MVTQNVANVFATGSTVGPLVSLLWPSSIVAGDTLMLVCLHNNGSALSGTGGAGTGIGVPAGFTERTDWGSPHVYSSVNGVSVWTKTAVGTESGVTPGCTWGGGSGGSASKTFWVAAVIPKGRTLSGFAWADAASLTTPGIAVPTVSHTGADEWITMAFERGSSPSTTYTASPTGTTGLAEDFTTGGGSAGGAWARATAVDRDGTVGSGTWTTNTSGSAGRIVLTVVTTLERVSKSTSTTWQTRARVAKTTAATWDVRARLAKTQATTWSVLARVAKSVATTWDVAGSLARISKSLSTTWQTRARVAKATAATWDVAGSLVRISKATATTWTVRARVAKTQATTWDTRKRVAKTQSTTWNVSSMLAEASWPAFMAHRGADPGPEETMYAYDAAYGFSSNFWHEMDAQTLNDGVTVVANHDDTVNRMYSSGPVATGNVSAISPANWDLEFWRVNTGYTGSARQAMRVSAWVAKYGKSTTGTPVCGLIELKAGNDMADLVATLNGCQGSVVIECSTLADCDAGIAAGYDVAYWRPAANPIFSEFTSHGIKYLVMDYNDMTGTIASNAIAAGVKVILYTVNSTANRDAMLALFSDDSYVGFLSNKPYTIDGTTRISKSTATTWTTKARVAKSTATTWSTRARVAKTQSATWDTRARLAKTTATTWQARARLSKATATTWTTRARVAKSTSTSWDVDGSLARISKTLATTWQVRQRVTRTASTTWDTKARLSKATAASWNVRARATKATPTTWDVRARTSKTQATTYGVRQRVVVTRSATWDVEMAASVGPPPRILRAHLRIPGARGELDTPQTAAQLRIPVARGELR